MFLYSVSSNRVLRLAPAKIPIQNNKAMDEAAPRLDPVPEDEVVGWVDVTEVAHEDDVRLVCVVCRWIAHVGPDPCDPDAFDESCATHGSYCIYDVAGAPA